MKKNFGVNPWLFPMPVLIISAYDREGVPCAMNAAWGGMAGENLIAMCVTPTHKTILNARERGAFTVAVGDVEHEVECDYVGVVSGNDVPDKFARAGFHATKSEFVDAPVIDELRMSLDCELLSYDEETHIMIGKIVNIQADESVLDSDGNIDPSKFRPITFDPVNHKYIALGEVVGDAFADGNKL